MTSAEFDTRRRQLGLSVAETAIVCSRAGRPVAQRTVNRWINHLNGDVPGNVAQALTDLEDRMDKMVEVAVRTAADHTLAGPVPLHRYRSQAKLDASPHAGLLFGAHAILIAWTADALAAEGIDAEIVWWDQVS